MTRRSKRFFAVILTLVVLLAYVLAAMAFASYCMMGLGVGVQLILFMLLGCLWLPIVMAIIRWAETSKR